MRNRAYVWRPGRNCHEAARAELSQSDEIEKPTSAAEASEVYPVNSDTKTLRRLNKSAEVIRWKSFSVKCICKLNRFSYIDLTAEHPFKLRENLR